MPALDHPPQRITPAFTGASGMPYALRLVDFVVARILDQLHVANELTPRWGRTAPGGDTEC